MGRVTYQGFAAAWPSRTDDAGFADRMNSLPKYVATSASDELTWNNSKRIDGNIGEAVTMLKEETAGDIVVYGSAELVHTLMAHGLIDEYRLLVFPVVLGIGKRLFAADSRATLQLVESRAFDTGVVLLSYQPAGIN